VNCTFVLITKSEIYPGITWNNAITYITSGLAIILLVGSFGIGSKIYEKFKKGKIELKKVYL
jgi:hypothetical protein